MYKVTTRLQRRRIDPSNRVIWVVHFLKRLRSNAQGSLPPHSSPEVRSAPHWVLIFHRPSRSNYQPQDRSKAPLLIQIETKTLLDCILSLQCFHLFAMVLDSQPEWSRVLKKIDHQSSHQNQQAGTTLCRLHVRLFGTFVTTKRMKEALSRKMLFASKTSIV